MAFNRGKYPARITYKKIPTNKGKNPQQSRWDDSTSYRQELYFFKYNFADHDNELVKTFESFIKRNLMEFFTNAEQLGVIIPVTYADARSVIGLGNKYRPILQELANTIHMNSSNNDVYHQKDRHQQTIFSVILAQATSFAKLMNLIKDYLKNIDKSYYEWNVVYYTYYEDMVINLSASGGIK